MMNSSFPVETEYRHECFPDGSPFTLPPRLDTVEGGGRWISQQWYFLGSWKMGRDAIVFGRWHYFSRRRPDGHWIRGVRRLTGEPSHPQY